MPLALATFAAGLLMFEKIRTRTPWNLRDRIGLFAALTAAMFIKGPVVWAFFYRHWSCINCAGGGAPIFRMDGAGGLPGLLPLPCSAFGLLPGSVSSTDFMKMLF